MGIGTVRHLSAAARAPKGMPSRARSDRQGTRRMKRNERVGGKEEKGRVPGKSTKPGGHGEIMYWVKVLGRIKVMG